MSNPIYKPKYIYVTLLLCNCKPANTANNEKHSGIKLLSKNVLINNYESF